MSSREEFSLLIKRIPDGITVEKLISLYSEYGTVLPSTRIFPARNIAFVDFLTEESLNAAQNANVAFNSIPLKVERAKPKKVTKEPGIKRPQNHNNSDTKNIMKLSSGDANLKRNFNNVELDGSPASSLRSSKDNENSPLLSGITKTIIDLQKTDNIPGAIRGPDVMTESMYNSQRKDTKLRSPLRKSVGDYEILKGESTNSIQYKTPLARRSMDDNLISTHPFSNDRSFERNSFQSNGFGGRRSDLGHYHPQGISGNNASGLLQTPLDSFIHQQRILATSSAPAIVERSLNDNSPVPPPASWNSAPALMKSSNNSSLSPQNLLKSSRLLTKGSSSNEESTTEEELREVGDSPLAKFAQTDFFFDDESGQQILSPITQRVDSYENLTETANGDDDDFPRGKRSSTLEKNIFPPLPSSSRYETVSIFISDIPATATIIDIDDWIQGVLLSNPGVHKFRLLKGRVKTKFQKGFLDFPTEKEAKLAFQKLQNSPSLLQGSRLNIELAKSSKITPNIKKKPNESPIKLASSKPSMVTNNKTPVDVRIPHVPPGTTEGEIRNVFNLFGKIKKIEMKNLDLNSGKLSGSRLKVAPEDPQTLLATFTYESVDSAILAASASGTSNVEFLQILRDGESLDVVVGPFPITKTLPYIARVVSQFGNLMGARIVRRTTACLITYEDEKGAKRACEQSVMLRNVSVTAIRELNTSH